MSHWKRDGPTFAHCDFSCGAHQSNKSAEIYLGKAIVVTRLIFSPSSVSKAGLLCVI